MKIRNRSIAAGAILGFVLTSDASLAQCLLPQSAGFGDYYFGARPGYANAACGYEVAGCFVPNVTIVGNAWPVLPVPVAGPVAPAAMAVPLPPGVEPLPPVVVPGRRRAGAAMNPVADFHRAAEGVDGGDRLEEIRRRVDALKRSTPAGRARADRLISAGDHAFAEHVYGRATSRYREAIARAPDYPEPHFRLAHAYVATRRYNLALTSVLMALELSGTGRRDGFSLAELYRGNKFSRRQHDEQLLDAALREPEDGGLQFLIGVTLHYGGNPLKAREHFRAASELEGPQQVFTRHFLPVQVIGEPEADLAAVAAGR